MPGFSGACSQDVSQGCSHLWFDWGWGGDDDLLTSGSLTQLVRSYWLSAEGLSSLLCVPLCRAA